MESVLRGLAIYLILMIVFRLTGKRSLAQITTFDFILLLIIGEATQQALLGEDFSMINALVVILTLIMADVGMSLWKQRSPWMGKLIDGMPLVILKDGQPIAERMNAERVDEDDILHAARESHGLERLDQIKYAVLERSGGISIIPSERK